MMLEVNAVNAFYGNIRALWDVSLRVDEKEIVALVGANGAGKTTMLNTISGLIHPTSGSIPILRSEDRSDGFLSNC
jgi:branched-chain amino acid transport system ATP-binding protein